MLSQTPSGPHLFTKRVKTFCSILRKGSQVYAVPESVIAHLEDKVALLNDATKTQYDAHIRFKTARVAQVICTNQLWDTMRSTVGALRNCPQWTEEDAHRLHVVYKHRQSHMLFLTNFESRHRDVPAKWQMAADWVQQFCKDLADLPHLAHIANEYIPQLLPVCEALPALAEAHYNAYEDWQLCRAPRQVCMEAVLAIIKRIFAGLLQNPACNIRHIRALCFSYWNWAYAFYGNEIPETMPLALNGYQPRGAAVLCPAGVKISFVKDIATGMLVFARLQGEADFILLARTESNVFIDARPVAGTEPEIREYQLKGLRKNQELGLPGEVFSLRVNPSDIPDPIQRPIIRVRERLDTVRIEIEKKPHITMNVYSKVEGQADFTFLGHAPTRGSYTDARPLQNPLVGEQRYYYVLLVRDGAETGPPSIVHTIFISPAPTVLSRYQPAAVLIRTRASVHIIINRGVPRKVSINIYTRMQGDPHFTLLAHAPKNTWSQNRCIYLDRRPHPRQETRCREYKLVAVADGQEVGRGSDVYVVGMG